VQEKKRATILTFAAIPRQFHRAIPLILRYKVLERDNGRCVICGASPRHKDIILHVDHIVPFSKGGLTTLDNLQTLCSDCNLGKKDMMPSQELLRSPRRVC